MSSSIPRLTTPPTPPLKWAGDFSGRLPKVMTTDEYRRAVFLGTLTPDGRPAIDGVAVSQPEENAETDASNAALMHEPEPEDQFT